MKTLQLFAAVTFVMGLLGCSRSKPTEGEAREEISQIIARDSKNLIKLQSFVKTNGIESADGHGYELEFTGVVLFQEDCTFHFKNDSLFSAQKGIPDRVRVLHEGRKGQTYKFSGRIAFRMTERGWRSSNYQFTDHLGGVTFGGN